MSVEMKKAIPFSNLDRIISNPENPARLSSEVFKYIPEQDSWCYFYEKAELARQQKNWPEVVRLAGSALSEGRKVDSTWEYIPYIEGYALTGNYSEARQLSDLVYQAMADGKKPTRDLLCSTWVRIADSPESGAELKTEAAAILSEFGCP
jgi:hypothetical protein